MSKYKLFAATEDSTVEHDAELAIDAVEQEAVAAGEGTADGVLETQERIQQIEGMGEFAEQASADAETLEDIAETAEESVETGGMDQTAAAVAEIAVEALCARLTLTRTKPVGTGIENFGGASTRLRATKLAAEETKELATKAWAGIQAFIAKIIAFVKETFTKLTAFFGDVDARAVVLKKKASEFKGTKPTEIKKAGLAAKLSIDGKVEVAQLGEVLQKGLSSAKDLAAILPKSLEEVEKAAKTGESTKDELIQTLAAVTGTFDSVKKEVTNKEGFAEGADVYQVGITLPGERGVYMEVVKETKVKISVKATPGVKASAEETLDALDSKQVEKIQDIIIGSKKDREAVATSIKSLERTATKLAVLKLVPGEKNKEGLVMLRGLIKDTVSNAGAPLVSYMGAILKSASAVQDYCNLCLKGEADKKEEAAA